MLDLYVSELSNTIFQQNSSNSVVLRVLARISKMPVPNSNSKISACPDLAANLLQILIAATLNSIV